MITLPENLQSAELEAILTATLLFLPTMGLHVLMCRTLGSRQAVRWMFMSFLVYIIAATALSAASTPAAWLTLLATAGFWCLSYMELFSMLCRGFSLSILVYLNDRPGDREKDVLQNYGGVGARGLLNKRIESITALGFVRKHKDALELQGGLPKFIATSTLVYKRFFRLGKGG